MRSQDFPGCCAGLLLTGFGGTNRIIGQYEKYTEKEITDFLNSMDGSLKYGNRGFIMLTLNNEQVPYMKSYLRKFKYKLLKGNIKSPGHYGSTIFIYMKCKETIK